MYDIKTLGEDVLKTKAEPVTLFNQDLLVLVEEMIASMQLSKGIGLAAPQIGILKKIIICQDFDKDPEVFINPEIIETSQDLGSYEEGCLSIPGVYADIIRPITVKVQAQNINGKFFKVEAEGLLARILQHEIDHLEGVLFIDHLNQKQQEKLVKLYKKRTRM